MGPSGWGFVTFSKSFAFSAGVDLDLNAFITGQVVIETWKSHCIEVIHLKRIIFWG